MTTMNINKSIPRPIFVLLIVGFCLAVSSCRHAASDISDSPSSFTETEAEVFQNEDGDILSSARNLLDETAATVSRASHLDGNSALSSLNSELLAAERCLTQIDTCLKRIDDLTDKDEAAKFKKELKSARKDLEKLKSNLSKAKKSVEKKEASERAEDEKKRKKQNAANAKWDNTYESERARLRKELKTTVDAIKGQLSQYGEIMVKWVETQRRIQQVTTLLGLERQETRQIVDDLTTDEREMKEAEIDLLNQILNRKNYNDFCMRQLSSQGKLLTSLLKPKEKAPEWTLIVDWSQPVSRTCVFTGADLNIKNMVSGQEGAYLVVLTPIVKHTGTSNSSKVFGGDYAKWETLRGKTLEGAAQLAEEKAEMAFNLLVQKKWEYRQATTNTAKFLRDLNKAYLDWRDAVQNKEAAAERLYEIRNASIFLSQAYRQFTASELYSLRMPFENGGNGIYAIRSSFFYTLPSESEKKRAKFIAGPLFPTSVSVSRLELSNGLVALPGDYIALVVPNVNAVETRIMNTEKKPLDDDYDLEKGDSFYKLDNNWNVYNGSSPIILELDEKRQQPYRKPGDAEWFRASFMLYGDWLYHGNMPQESKPQKDNKTQSGQETTQGQGAKP